MKLNYFDLEEFDSPDIQNSGRLMDVSFLEMLDEARDIAEVPFIISSGYRSPAYNEKVGGVSNSSHLKGLAADITCTESTERFIIINSLLLAGFNRIGVGKTFIHVDNDPDKTSDVIWVYN
tara:strand:+ start:2989 stop:3351 length:363 start_codon:yes stop_codon:yes gene_type:complete